MINEKEDASQTDEENLLWIYMPFTVGSKKTIKENRRSDFLFLSPISLGSRRCFASGFGLWAWNLFIAVVIAVFFFSCQPYSRKMEMVLEKNWAVQSSDKVHETGEKVSKAGFDTRDWYPAVMPSTILKTLVENKVYKDPYYGTNLSESKGYFPADTYLYDLPEDSPFSVPWWFRTEFELPRGRDHVWLHLSSLNYKANIWLNGVQIADINEIAGVHRIYDLDITGHAVQGGKNCLALEITPPVKGTDLSVRWMQGSRMVPDKDAGIWYDVKIIRNGALRISHPHITTDLNLPDTTIAFVTLTAEIMNQSGKDVRGVLEGKIRPVDNLAEGGNSAGGEETFDFAKDLMVRSNSVKKVKVCIEIKNPELWWPYMSGKQNLYDLRLRVKPVSRKISDEQNIRFGIRKVTSYLEDFGHSGNQYVRIFRINGKDIFIKGGNWTQTLMLEKNPERNEAEILHMRNMHFNAIRTEGFWGDDHFFDLCDKYGIMMFDGTNCCSIWERWDKWNDRSYEIAGKSVRDQIIRKRNHPCFVDWLLASDKHVPFRAEKLYTEMVEKYDGTRPYQSNAMYSTTPICGCTGLDHDPYPETYTYLPPSAWYGMRPKDERGNFGPYEFFEFNTEVGPGAEIIPPMESMRAMMPEEELWPKSKSWDIRLSSDEFSYQSTDAFYSRYGEPKDLESYTVKAQAFQKEAFRAMTEAFRKNKYKSSGILIYRLNAGWPSLCYYLYDYYLRPNGAYSGVQQGYEPLHVLYAYDDHSVVVVNDLYRNFQDLTVTAQVFNMDMTLKYAAEEKVDIGADAVRPVLKIPKTEGLTQTYFLNLELKNDAGELLSSNFYWLTTRDDADADFRELMKLPQVELKATTSYREEGKEGVVRVTLTNASDQLAFLINPKILAGLHGKELLPSYWSAGYFSVLPSSSREIEAKFNLDLLDGQRPYLMLEGWNIEPVELEVTGEKREVTPRFVYKDVVIPESVRAGEDFEVQCTVVNAASAGKALLKDRQYLFIDGRPAAYRRVALAPGEAKELVWPSIRIDKPGMHTIKAGALKPMKIRVK